MTIPHRLVRPLPVVLVLLLFSLGCSGRSMAASSLSFMTENDFFGSAGTDRYFTNGINLTYATERRPDWLDRLADLSHRQDKSSLSPCNRRVSYTGGQDIYTPKVIAEEELIADDRPYAGWLYLGMGVHDRSPLAAAVKAAQAPEWRSQDNTELILGMIGPQSYAGDVQYWWHENVIGFNNTSKPSGWDNQLKNELAFALLREHKWRARRLNEDRTGLEGDLIPHLGMAAGTVTSYLAAGAEARLGWRLPDDFGSAKYRAGISPTRIAAPLWDDRSGYGKEPWLSSVHLFAKAEGRVVLRDIFLDGNTFAASHRIDREPLLYSVVSGVAVLWRERFEINFTHVYQSKEFEGQPLAHIYGSVTVSCYW